MREILQLFYAKIYILN